MAIELASICTAADYDAALVEFGRLWGAGRDTLEGVRLDALATLIDAYEANHRPIHPPGQGEAARFRSEQQDIGRME